jgi:hypothetical protein
MDSRDKELYDYYELMDKCVSVSEEDTEFRGHFDKWSFYDYDKTTKKPLNITGQYFLYENLTSDKKVYYPKLSIYLNSLPYDQTIGIECYDVRRSWEWRKEIKYTHEGKDYSEFVGERESIIQRHIQWGNYVMIYGVWDSRPDWKSLRRAYENSWWFHKTKKEKRNIKIDELLK